MAHTLLPETLLISVITLAELEAGVLAARTVESRSARLRTLSFVAQFDPLPIDQRVASHWARLRVELHRAGRSVGVNDLWLAATALAHDLPIATQDSDFDAFGDLGILDVIRV